MRWFEINVFVTNKLLKIRDMYNLLLIFINLNLKSATKPFNVLLACTHPLITELSYKLRLKCPLLPTPPLPHNAT